MTPLEQLGFKDGQHLRAPIRAVLSHNDERVRLVYELGENFLSSIIVDVDNTYHEILMGLTDMKKIAELLNK